MPTREDETLRVLIIDSDNVRRGMLACTLPASRYSLEFAKSAERGLDLLNQVQPDIVLVGWDQSARELCQHMRSLPNGAACTLMLMDERFRDAVLGEAEAEAAGADAYLPFPFESSLFEEQVTNKYRPVKAPLPIGSASENSGNGDSSQIFLTNYSTTTNDLEDDEESAWAAFREQVDFFNQNLESLNYYQMLQISNVATAVEIKDAYFKRSMDFHPDRFMQLTDEALRTAIYNVYKRMSEAFKVLSNPESRSQYDIYLTGSDREHGLRYLERSEQLVSPEDPNSAALTPTGKRYLHFAKLAETEGNLRSARMYLLLGVQSEPQNSALRLMLDKITSRIEAKLPKEGGADPGKDSVSRAS